jgi:hypothetical protein
MSLHESGGPSEKFDSGAVGQDLSGILMNLVKDMRGDTAQILSNHIESGANTTGEVLSIVTVMDTLSQPMSAASRCCWN